MPPTDQNSVDALLAQIQNDVNSLESQAQSPEAATEAANAADTAAALANQIAGEMEPPTPGPGTTPESPAAAEADSFVAPVATPTSDIQRLLAIEVPVIVQLGMRRLSVGEVMRLAVGAIVEFGKSAEEELDLLVNNKPIGKGHAVKVGENFGIKITVISPVKETIRKLGTV